MGQMPVIKVIRWMSVSFQQSLESFKSRARHPFFAFLNAAWNSFKSSPGWRTPTDQPGAEKPVMSGKPLRDHGRHCVSEHSVKPTNDGSTSVTLGSNVGSKGS